MLPDEVKTLPSWKPTKGFDTVHMWMGMWPPPLAEKQDLAKNVLCFNVDSTMTLEKAWLSEFTVTNEKDKVTCQECLELIHA